jgi:hypothetical protein
MLIDLRKAIRREVDVLDRIGLLEKCKVSEKCPCSLIAFSRAAGQNNSLLPSLWAAKQETSPNIFSEGVGFVF